MRILHGENIVQSRNRLTQLLAEAKEKNLVILHVDTAHLDLPTLENALMSQSLFGEEKLVIIEELHSLPKSKRKDELIATLGKTESNVLLWEKKVLSAPMLKKFPGAHAEVFKVTNAVFQWLDMLSGAKNPMVQKKMIEGFQKALLSDGDFMCFSMLIRQVRLLIQMKDGAAVSLAPFMIDKLKRQATTFTLDQLLHVHRHLLEMDMNQKTSNSKLGLSREIELLLVTM